MNLRRKKKRWGRGRFPHRFLFRPRFSFRAAVTLSWSTTEEKNNKNYQLCRLDQRTNLLFELIKRQVVQVSFGCNSTEETVKAKSRKIILSNITWTERAQRALSDISPQ